MIPLLWKDVSASTSEKFVVACLMVGPAAEDPRVELRQFGTFTEDLVRLKDWIEAEQCTHAVYGEHWIVLEASVQRVGGRGHGGPREPNSEDP